MKSPGELFFVTAFFQWPYFFGLLVCGATLFIAASGQARYFRALWFALAVVIAIMTWRPTGLIAERSSERV